jgi:hypothetical protein
MGDLESRFFGDLAGRLSGPYMFRFFLQPLMGLIYAFRDGLKDAKAGRPPYFWALFYDPAERRHLGERGLARHDARHAPRSLHGRLVRVQRLQVVTAR